MCVCVFTRVAFHSSLCIHSTCVYLVLCVCLGVYIYVCPFEGKEEGYYFVPCTGSQACVCGCEYVFCV